MVPVRSHAPKELICQFHELAERLSALGRGDMSPPLIADVRALKFSASFGLNGKQGSKHEERTKMKNGKLDGKVAVVTGASKGIGARIAKEFATEGAAVVVNYGSDQQGANQVVDEIAKRGGKAIAIQGNVAKKADVERLFAEAEKAFGKIDIVVNNAGVYEFMPLEEVTEQQFHRMFDTNVLGILLVTQEGLRHFKANGGSIINISSLASSLTPPTGVIYNATKAAVDAITRTLAKELGARKIRVNSINPGMVVTEGVLAGGYTEGDMRKTFESLTPLGRIGETEDIAPAAVFFASDGSAWITGETLLIAGGLR
jgi:3-oxoacyl-[acyl-carrier protein] reductase